MAISQSRSKRKPSGSVYRSYRKKRKNECGNSAVLTKIDKSKVKCVRVTGGNEKLKLLRSDAVNLMNPKTKKCVKATIKNVVDNTANRNFVRANILTKGTVVDTDKGKARITNRPGQEGTVNAVLI